MKIIFSAIILMLTASFVQSQEKDKKKEIGDLFTVSGNVKGLDTDFMSIDYKDENGIRILDSISVKDNSFSYTAKITQATHFYIWPKVERTIKRVGRGLIPVVSSKFSFLASPGDDIVFKGDITDFVNAYPSGNDANNDLAKINREIYPLMNKSVNISLKRRNSTGGEFPKILADSLRILNSEVARAKKDFVFSNPKSKAAVWYLSDMMARRQISNKEVTKAFRNFDEGLSEYRYYKEVAARIEGLKSITIGKTLPNFSTKNTMDGNEFQFNSLKGKYVLIDFWGTWCGPCISEMPKVKEYKNKYKDKLVVLGINKGDTKEKIEKFVVSKGYDWKQLLSGQRDEDLVVKFNVTSFPTKFIIDPDGKILHKSSGISGSSFTKIDQLLKE